MTDINAVVLGPPGRTIPVTDRARESVRPASLSWARPSGPGGDCTSASALTGEGRLRSCGTRKP